MSTFCDPTKAFDNVNHDILFTKLETYGERGVALDWVRSHIKSNVSKSFSRECQILKGVPQGSVLGPLLFLVYLNDHPLPTNNCHTTLFSVDTTITVSSKS